MSTSPTGYEHIIINDTGVPVIDGTNMKVVELIKEHLAFGWSPAELHFQHPYLSMAQIHSALGYYWDHKEEIDRDLERRYLAAESIRKSLAPSPFIERLKKRGLI